MEFLTRKSCRGQVTKLINSVNEIIDSHNVNGTSDIDTLEKAEDDFCVLLERLKTASDNLNKANIGVKSTIKPEDLEREAENVTEYEDKVCNAIAILTQRIKRIRKYQERLELTRGSSSVINNALTSPQSQGSAAVKLQKLHMKRFSGNFRDWVPFWEQFRTLVHVNPSLSTIDKFNYLESVITGKAAESIAGFTPSETCYEDAISLLREQFGNTEKIIDLNMQQLLSVPPIHTKHDVAGLRSLYNSVLAATRSLRNLGVEPNNYYIMLKGVLLRCLPNELCVDFHRYYTDVCVSDDNDEDDGDEVSSKASVSSASIFGDKQVDSLIKFLKREVDSLEKASEFKVKLSSSKVLPKTKFLKPVSTALGLFTGVGDSCYFCASTTHITSLCNSARTLEDRKALLKKEGRCYRCCERGHNSKRCSNPPVCNTCNGRHATCMCDPHYYRKQYSNKHKSTVQPTKQILNLHVNNGNDVYLQTAFIYVSNNTKLVLVKTILDGGSQMTFIRKDLSQSLNLPIVSRHKLIINSFGSDKPGVFQVCNRVKHVLKSQFNSNYLDIEAIEVPAIAVDSIARCKTTGKLISGLSFADYPIDERAPDGIGLLIGADIYWQVVTGEIRRVTDKLTAVNTIFGWTLHGPSDLQLSDISRQCLNVCSCEDIQQFWRLETIGISSHNTSDMKRDSFELIKRDGIQLIASLPWKEDRRKLLDDNFSIAFSRLQSLVRKLTVNNEIKRYDHAIRELLSNDFAEIISERVENTTLYYMPHRAVYRDDRETTKIRIVFDASSHAPREISLNDCLETGENLLPEILSVLIKFRNGFIGIIADIEKAFLAIRLHPKEQDYHRFLWFANETIEGDPLPPVAHFRMKRLTFGVKSSSYILCLGIRKLIQDYESIYPKTCEVMENSIYMDDFIASCDDEDACVALYTEAKEILSKGDMNLRKWATNNPNVHHKISVEEYPIIKKVLGVVWYLMTDELGVDLEAIKSELINRNSAVTKRTALRIASKIFDPFGILSPWSINFKILMQKIWKIRIGWDSELPENLEKIFHKHSDNVNSLTDITIPRCIKLSNSIVRVEIHVFADASPNAYGAVAYLRVTNNDGKHRVVLLCAKNRVAPLKSDNSNELTLPKLELTAAVIAVRLLTYLKEKLRISIDAEIMWTDSKITLCWILGPEKRLQAYVENRVVEIKSKSSIESWRHCPGADNPADLLTRGVSASTLVKSSAWLNGRQWLELSSEHWPLDRDSISLPSWSLMVQINDSAKSTICSEPIFPADKYSSWKRMLRVTAYTMKAVNIFKNRTQDGSHFIAAEDIERAEQYWIRYIQQREFSREIHELQSFGRITFNSKLITLYPFLDKDFILRVGGRFGNEKDEDNIKHPIILPKSSPISELVAADMHEQLFHAGVSTTLTQLRTKFWIIRGRQLVTTVKNRCAVCKFLSAKPATQPFALIPRDRNTLSKPFDVIGIDFAGPLYVSNELQQQKKTYIMLITCAAVRAVHLEITTNLTTESCLLSLRRFFARRGVPSVIYSDNASTFKKSATELKKLKDSTENESFRGFLSNKQIKWKFVVERAPWWGGFWERLVKVVKDSIKRAIGRAILNYEQLNTLLIEVENFINSRPLTYLGDDPLDLSPLTPAHFIMQISMDASLSNEIHSLQGHSLRHEWKNRLKVLSNFKKRWYSEYVLQLRSLHHNIKTASANIKPGNVVIVNDATLPRSLWHLAIIERVFPGRDGRIRSCEIRFGNGSRYRRPIQLISPLELMD